MPGTEPEAASDRDAAEPSPAPRRLSEDWLATILGLILLGLALARVIPPGWVP